MTPKGWHSRGYLPHFDSPETIQFITFRLADSLPRHVTEALKTRRPDWRQALATGHGARPRCVTGERLERARRPAVPN